MLSTCDLGHSLEGCGLHNCLTFIERYSPCRLSVKVTNLLSEGFELSILIQEGLTICNFLATFELLYLSVYYV